MVSVAEAFVTIRGDTSHLDRDIEHGLTQSIGNTGRTLTRTLTPAAIAVGAIARSAFSEWDSGLDAIRAGTGATGAELEALGASMRRVGGQVTAPLSQIGQVMADVATRTGLTGAPLERLTKQLLDLDRLGNRASVETVSRAFGDWAVATDDQSDALDRLFRASQATGPSVDRLGQLITSYGAPLRELGFGFDEAAALMGKFEQEGVNTELVMGGLRQALGRMARAGEDPIETFQRVSEEIKRLGPGAETTGLAMELFGARAGVDMAKAIEEGRFEIGELLATVRGGEDTIAQAAADTADWGDKFAMLRNRVFAVIGPFGEVGMAAAGVAAGIGPLMMGLSGVAGAMRAVNLAFLANPWVVAAAAIVALTVVVVKNWDTIKSTILGAWDAITGSTRVNWTAIQSTIDSTIKMVTGLVSSAIAFISRAWSVFGDDLLRGARLVWSLIAGTVENAIRLVQGILTTVMALISGDWGRAWEGIRQVLSAVWAQMNLVVSGAVEAVRVAIGLGLAAVRFLWDEGWRLVGGTLTSAWDAITSAVSTGVGKIVEFFKKLPGMVKDAIFAVPNFFADIGKDIIGKIVEGITGAAGAIGSAVSGAISRMNPFGDGPGAVEQIGRQLASGAASVGGGQFNAPLGSQGGPAVNMARAAIAQFGGRVTSTYRDPEHNRRIGGSPTSYHMDRNNPAADIVTANMARTFSWLASTYGQNVRELIYGNTMIRRGVRSAYRRNDHWDHIHIAHKGGEVSETWPTLPGLRSNERPVITEVGERIIPKDQAGGDTIHIERVEVHCTDAHDFVEQLKGFRQLSRAGGF
jgi:TP901 family phage tail tape measure protein